MADNNLALSVPSTEAVPFPFTFQEQLRVVVLGVEERRLVCYPLDLIGRRLIARLSARVTPDACIRVDFEDALVFGEVSACWQQGMYIFGAFEMMETLVGLKELESTLEELRDASTDGAQTVHADDACCAA